MTSRAKLAPVLGATLLLACSAPPQSTAIAAAPSGTSAPPAAATAGPAAPLDVTFGAECHVRGLLPDPACTPGAVDPAVTQENIASTICRRGYTATVRPPVSYTEPLKRQQMLEYGFTDPISAHEEDHLVPLELGGAPSDPRNLWPEPGASPNPKDEVENRLHALVCGGAVSLAVAQHAIATDWTVAINSVGG